MEPTRWYPSKVDTWLACALAIGPLVPLVMAIAWALAGHWDAALLPLGSFALMLLIYAGLVLPMRYGFGGDELVVRAGMVRRRIPLRTIRAVRPTQNPLSSPALSLDRLRIEHERGALMISPAEREAFLDDLAARAGLTRAGDGLVRGA